KYDQHRAAYPTHHSTNSNSRIDFIWSSGDVISNFNFCDTEEVLPSISDHSLVILSVDNFFTAKQNKRRIPSKIIFDYDKMSDDKWTKF
ncbi:2221_t:CDS:1, partial [Funneliformis geosporum]